MMCLSMMNWKYSEHQSASRRSGTYDLRITSLDALELSYSGNGATKLGGDESFSLMHLRYSRLVLY